MQLLFSLLMLFFCSPIFIYAQASKQIPANDKSILYAGRADHKDPLSPIISWAGTQISTRFTGTSIHVVFNSKNADTYYNAFVDGELQILSLKKGRHVYLLAEALKDTTHELVLYKRDSPWNPQRFEGLIIDSARQLYPVVPKARKIEFYGDSKTQGAKAEQPGTGVDIDLTYLDNNYMTYGAITSRYFNAAYSCIAKNGLSLTPYKVRNNLPAFYDRSGASEKYSFWDFNNWQPEIVCINLGANDHPFPIDFQERYILFVKALRQKYPSANIILLSGPFAKSSHLSDATTLVVESLNKQGDKKVCHHIFKTFYSNPGHPRLDVHSACAKELIELITMITGW
jgi:hypothetical protein